MTSATCMSFNLSGFSFRKKVFLEDLFSRCVFDFVFLQEHFLLSANTRRLNFDANYKSCESSALKCTVKGRSKRGTAVLWNVKYDMHIDEIYQTDSRFCAISLFNRKVVVLSAYFPVDSNRANKVDDAMTGLVDDLTCFLSKFPDSAVSFGVDLVIDWCKR